MNWSISHKERPRGVSSICKYLKRWSKHRVRLFSVGPGDRVRNNGLKDSKFPLNTREKNVTVRWQVE